METEFGSAASRADESLPLVGESGDEAACRGCAGLSEALSRLRRAEVEARRAENGWRSLHRLAREALKRSRPVADDDAPRPGAPGARRTGLRCRGPAPERLRRAPPLPRLYAPARHRAALLRPCRRLEDRRNCQSPPSTRRRGAATTRGQASNAHRRGRRPPRWRLGHRDPGTNQYGSARRCPRLRHAHLPDPSMRRRAKRRRQGYGAFLHPGRGRRRCVSVSHWSRATGLLDPGICRCALHPYPVWRPDPQAVLRRLDPSPIR